ncbi:unnamed protein product, partial [Ostreobium quekettii]
LSVFRPTILVEEENFNTVAEAAAADASLQSSDPDVFRVSSARVWQTREGLRCFCPIVLFEEDDSKKGSKYGG